MLRAVSACGLALSSVALAAPRAAPPGRVVTGSGVIAATVNGAPGRLLLDPGGPAMPMLTAEWAGRAGLKAGWIDVNYAIGPELIEGKTALARIALDAEPTKRRVGWIRPPWIAGYDGVIGPNGLPDSVIRFVLRPPIAGERTATLPVVTQGGLFAGWGERFAVTDVGGRPLRVRFDPHHRRTLATAGAGVRLAQALGGRTEGVVTREEIVFGVKRPVRDLALTRPLVVGPLSITRLGVRTADFGSAAGIPEGQAPRADPDEVVVTAKRKRDQSRDRVTLGADVLSRCSSIVFDKPAKLIRLTCA